MVAPIVFIVFGIAAYAFNEYRKTTKVVTVPSQTVAEYVGRVYLKIEDRGRSRLSKELETLNGRVQLAFEIRPDGSVDKLEVRQSSYNAAIDGQATRLVKISERFEPIPKSFASGPIPIAATLQFADGRVKVSER